MPGFDHLLNWRLLPGSHPFPGPDGGTCINEAALVAAGLPYRAIRSSDDCPPCFSRPLSAYALGLNDAMPDGERHRLMAFVLRLSGSADTATVEAERTSYLALESIRRLMPPLLDRAGLTDLAVRCATARDLADALAAARSAAWQGGAKAQTASARRDWIVGAPAAATSRTATAAIRAVADPRCAAEIAEGAAVFAPGTWARAADILDGALRIGRQAPDADLFSARHRLDAARSAAHAGV